MHLDNFAEIISGKILNSPCISSINKLTSNIREVQSGDAFIAKNQNNIKEALNRGAYAIITDTYVDILDDEIAWILVSDIAMSILRFVKYSKLINPIEIFFFDEISFLLAKNIIKDIEVGFASSTEELLESLHKKYIIINFDILLFEIAYLQDSNNYPFRIIKQTLFETKLIFDNTEFSLTLPNIFIKDLSNVILFCRQKFINIILQIDSKDFLPIFINANATISSYGHSMRFVYGALDSALIKRYIDFINSASWGKSLCVTNNHYDDIDCVSFSSLESLKKILKDSRYHFFVVDGIKTDEIASILKQDIDSVNLFNC